MSVVVELAVGVSVMREVVVLVCVTVMDIASGRIVLVLVAKIVDVRVSGAA